MIRPTWRLAAIVAVIGGAAAAVSGQQSPPAFKAGTDIVLVDFVVTDKSDRPVKGLTSADFVVKEDGKDRPIVSFSAFAGTDPSTPPEAAPRAAAATVLLVDDGHLDAAQTLRLRPDLKALLAKVGERSGTISLMAPLSKISEARTMPFGAASLTGSIDRIAGHRIDDHTDMPISDAEAIAIERGDSAMVTRVTSRFMAMNGSMKDDQAENQVRARAREVFTEARVRRQALYQSADLAFDWLADQPGRHSLVIVSPGFARDPEDPGYDRIVTRSLRVNAPISFLDSRGLQGFGQFDGVTAAGHGSLPNSGETSLARSDAALGAAVLSDDTGGVIVRNSNDLQKGLDRLFDSMSTYYVVGYERVAQSKSGFRKIKVETKAKGLNVRARRGYFDDVKK